MSGTNPLLDFASDNIVGASGPIARALSEAALAGPEGTYGTDRWTSAAKARLDALFECPVETHLVVTGTAANAMSLAALTAPWGGVLCHANAHVNEDEAGAPEFFSAGAKLFGIPGAAGKITPDGLRAVLDRFPRGALRQVEPMALSLSQVTECGTVYSPGEIAALASIAHEAGLGVHMDGARFANALVGLGCTAAEMTWKAGVDILSFGATKNGALACEAVVVFDTARARNAAVLRKRSGHTLSKGRLLGAQMAAYLEDGHWLGLARHANTMAGRLAEGLTALGCRLPWPCQANEIFAIVPRQMHEALQAAGSHYYEWDATGLPDGERPEPDEIFARLICSFETTAEGVEHFLAVARRAVR
jgi:threonine aldolase